MVELGSELWEEHVALVALYLRGGARPFVPSRRGWRTAIRAMRAHDGPPATRLSRGGLWSEATLLEDRGLWRWAESVAETALTPLCPGYPKRWLAVLREGAPAAVWARGSVEPGDWLGVVGSRRVSPEVGAFAREVGGEVRRLGAQVVSGGAVGCDTFAAEGAGGGVRLLPCGFDLVPPNEGMDLSVCAPGEEFSTANAMERNALIYAAAEATVIVHARLRQGGTWHGATDALRRRLGRLLVREDPTDDSWPAHRALIALGGVPLRSPDAVGAARAAPDLQPGLFSLG